MRGAAIGLLSLLLVGCASSPPVQLTDEVSLSDGTRIEFKRCLTPAHAKGTSIRLINVVVHDRGSARRDPWFVFHKKEIDGQLAENAGTMLIHLQNRFRWVCWLREADFAARKAELISFHDDALRATVQIALRLERAQGNQEYRDILREADELLDSFNAREPKSDRLF